MPSPQRLYEGYTSAELTTEFAALKLEMTDGTFTSLGGASKSSSIERPPIQERLKALRLEMRILGLAPPRPQKVQSRFIETGYNSGGTITE
jgi:hypothetical protein